MQKANDHLVAAARWYGHLGVSCFWNFFPKSENECFFGVSDRQILIFKKLNQVPVGSQPYKKMPYIFYFDIFISNQNLVKLSYGWLLPLLLHHKIEMVLAPPMATKSLCQFCDYNIKGLIDYRSVYLELIIWKSTSCQV
jgi:hypothetical protein